MVAPTLRTAAATRGVGLLRSGNGFAFAVAALTLIVSHAQPVYSLSNGTNVTQGLTPNGSGPPDARASLTLKVPLDIDLADLNATELPALKNGLLVDVATAGGFEPALVDTINLVQTEVGFDRRRRQTNPPIGATFIFKNKAVVNVTAVATTLNEAIEAGTLTVTLVIGGVTFTATVVEVATAIAAVVSTHSSYDYHDGSTFGILVFIVVAFFFGIFTQVLVNSCRKRSETIVLANEAQVENAGYSVHTSDSGRAFTNI